MTPINHVLSVAGANGLDRVRRLALRSVGLCKNVLQKTFGKFANGLRWRMRHLYDQGLYRLTSFHRRRLPNTLFIGVTGSAGKTTTKDLIANILKSHLSKGVKNHGSLNWPEDMVRLVLSTRKSDAYCVAEISAHGPGSVDLPVALVRPTIGVVTNIGADHLSAYKNRDAIAAEKSKLIKALPSDGVAILNADDPRVLAMRSVFAGRIVTYGLAAESMLRGTEIQSVWPDRLSFTATWNGESEHVHTQLCGKHWAPTVLAALATGVALGVPLAVAAKAVTNVEPFEGRMAPLVKGGITFIRDDWKAPLSTVEPAFEFMRQARAKRKIVVIGTISDYQGDSTRRYVEIAQLALAFADGVIFVGPRASAVLRAKRDPEVELKAFASLRDASTYLSGYLMDGDLVLLKGSHKADHMQRLIVALTADVQCWRSDCGRMESCDTCDLLHVRSGPNAAEEVAISLPSDADSVPVVANLSTAYSSTVIVVGLGNPETGRVNTPHNVGYEAVDILATRMAQDWVTEVDLAKVVRGEVHGVPVALIKPLTSMNDIGPALVRLARYFSFDVCQCILVHDDLALPIGAVRVRIRGSDGGHQGVRSILQAFQDDKFRRVKIGVGQPQEGQSVVDYVLTPFSVEQQAAVAAANQTAADRIVQLIREGKQQ